MASALADVTRCVASNRGFPGQLPRFVLPLGRPLASRILILAGDTDGNLGDLAIVTATCEQLRRIDRDIDIALVTSRPARDSRRLGISPIRRGLRGLPALIAAARGADYVICGGGGLFQDDDSLVKMPYWALRLLLVRLVAKRIIGFSIGAGPLDRGVSRLFARIALGTLRTISVRDRLAGAVLQPLTGKPVEVVPDPAFMLAEAKKEDARQVLGEAGVPLDRTPLVGVAARRWFHNSSNLLPYKYASRFGLRRTRGQQRMTTLVDRVAAALDQVGTRSGAHIVFLPTYVTTHENDAAVCRAIAARMQTASHSVLELDDPALYKSVCGLMSAMLCGRMHPAILAASVGTPVVSLAYNPKFAGMFALLERPELCIALSGFVADGAMPSRLASLLLDAVDRPEAFRIDTGSVTQSTRDYLARLLGEVADGTLSPAQSRR